MINAPRTKEQALKKRYCANAYRAGFSYKPHRCAYEVWVSFFALSYQCRRKNGQGISNLYCKQHGKMVK